MNFVSIRDGINLETPTGRMVAGILSSVAVYETEVHGERIRAGIEAKKQCVAEGKENWNVGRPAGTAHKLTPEVKEQLCRMKDEGKSVAVISRVLKISRQICIHGIEGPQIEMRRFLALGRRPFASKLLRAPPVSNARILFR